MTRSAPSRAATPSTSPCSARCPAGWCSKSATRAASVATCTRASTSTRCPTTSRTTASGQTFAEAFDALAAQIRGGTAASAVTAQPWFENLLVNLAPENGSRTRALAARQTANIINGNLNNLFVGAIDVFAAQPFNNRQSNELFYRTSIGRSNYHALLATLRKRVSEGLSFDLNYTLSRSLDQAGAVQNTANIQPNSFDPDAEYVLSAFDQTHNFNANYVYDLPFGRGRRFLGGVSGVRG